jgi:hypothetical protein
MAALLYLGDTVQARHLYRRYADGNPPNEIQKALDEWWSLGRAMTECNMTEVWARLSQLQQQQPKPYCDYAQEIGTSMCRRLIPKLATIWNNHHHHHHHHHHQSDVLLGLPRHEWTAFLEHHRSSLLLDDAQQNGNSKLGSDNTTAIMAFLESPTLRI